MNDAPLKEEPPKRGLLETVVELGFLGMATVCGLLFFAEGLGRSVLSAPLGALIFLAWCPFFWGKYWLSKGENRRATWFVFVCAAAFSAITIIATIIILVRSLRAAE